MPPRSFKKSRLSPEEMELWSEAYIQALCIYPDYDSDRAIYARYPVPLECLICKKLRLLLDDDLVNLSFPIFEDVI